MRQTVEPGATGRQRHRLYQIRIQLRARKWLELLKEIAPAIKQVAVLTRCCHRRRYRTVCRDAVRGALVRRGVETDRRCAMAAEIERAITAFARSSEWRLDRDGERGWRSHRDLIIALAARHKLPAVYFDRSFVAAGGLISYGPDLIDSTGARPAMSTASSRARSRPTCRCRRRPNTSWSINLKTAKALGLTVPPTARARRRGDRIELARCRAIGT